MSLDFNADSSFGGNQQYQRQSNFQGNNGFSKNNGRFSGPNRNFFKKKEEDTGPTRLYKTYAGTGNPDAPQEVLDQMTRLAKELEVHGFIVRTGGLKGPEEVFEKAVSQNNLELHLPWRGFDNKNSKFTFTAKPIHEIAKMFHPTYDQLKPVIHAFLAKNVRIVLGKDAKSPAMFVLCWSSDGAETSVEKTARTGNVGHAISVAASLRIPVFNLQKPDAESRLKKYLGLLSNG